MSNARHTVEQFHGHFANKDWARARELLHDDLSFEGPIDRFSRADDYIQAVRRLDAICKRVEVRKVLVDGDDVCVIWDMITDTPIGTAPIAEWFHVSGQKIDRVRVFFDARPFAAMFGK
ncbi:MAG TPA: nuclear transport factor 2 family protein [Kofleriaceae bacterium]|nr:nuclear transport factor 2 family protein [Kofleriaceae bacterium]